MLALALIASLAIVSQYFIQKSLSRSLNDAHVINVAGKQRMLSQQLVKHAMLYTAFEKASSRDTAFFFLKEWRVSHKQLKAGITGVGRSDVPSVNSPIIDSMFFDIEPIYQSLAHHFDLVFSEEKTDTRRVVTQILADEQAYVKKMDIIVNQYDEESTDKILWFKFLERILLLLTLIVIVAEGFFIFIPLTRYIQKVVLDLSKSKRELEVNNKSLNKLTNQTVNLERKQVQVRSVALIEGQEEERRRLSRELHDGVGQMLAGISLSVNALKRQISQGNAEKSKKTVEDVSEQLRATIEETRNVSFNLMPPILNDYGLVPAMKMLIQQFGSRIGLNIEFVYSNSNLRIEKTIEVGIYRIAQEALTNIHKHSTAKNVKINIEYATDNIVFEISDDGKGFDIGQLAIDKLSVIHNGVANMKTRTELLDGDFYITSSKQSGTQIKVIIPTSKIRV